jgi:hypothetical protein
LKSTKRDGVRSIPPQNFLVKPFTQAGEGTSHRPVGSIIPSGENIGCGSAAEPFRSLAVVQYFVTARRRKPLKSGVSVRSLGPEVFHLLVVGPVNQSLDDTISDRQAGYNHPTLRENIG